MVIQIVSYISGEQFQSGIKFEDLRGTVSRRLHYLDLSKRTACFKSVVMGEAKEPPLAEHLAGGIAGERSHTFLFGCIITFASFPQILCISRLWLKRVHSFHLPFSGMSGVLMGHPFDTIKASYHRNTTMHFFFKLQLSRIIPLQYSILSCVLFGVHGCVLTCCKHLTKLILNQVRQQVKLESRFRTFAQSSSETLIKEGVSCTKRKGIWHTSA